MINRYRVEIYDEIKSNDLTIYFDQGVDRDFLAEIAFSNLSRFSGNVKAYVFDTVKNKKISALIIPMETILKIKSQLKNTAKELGFV